MGQRSVLRQSNSKHCHHHPPIALIERGGRLSIAMDQPSTHPIQTFNLFQLHRPPPSRLTKAFPVTQSHRMGCVQSLLIRSNSSTRPSKHLGSVLQPKVRETAPPAFSFSQQACDPSLIRTQSKRADPQHRICMHPSELLIWRTTSSLAHTTDRHPPPNRPTAVVRVQVWQQASCLWLCQTKDLKTQGRLGEKRLCQKRQCVRVQCQHHRLWTTQDRAQSRLRPARRLLLC